MTVVIDFPVPWKPWSVNELTNTRQGNAIRTKQKHAWRDATVAAVNEARQVGGMPSGHLSPCNVHVTIPFTTNKTKRDPSNYVGTVVKVIVDALVFSSVWPDDNPEFVTIVEPTCIKGDTVTVTLTPRDEKKL